MRLGKHCPKTFDKKFSVNVRKKVKAEKDSKKSPDAMEHTDESKHAEEEQIKKEKDDFEKMISLCEQLSEAGFLGVYVYKKSRILEDLPEQVKVQKDALRQQDEESKSDDN